VRVIINREEYWEWKMMKTSYLGRNSAALWAVALLIGFVLTGCSPDFTDEQCASAQDCFPGEVCTAEGFCQLDDGQSQDVGFDAGPDATSDVGPTDDAGPDATGDVDEAQIAYIVMSPDRADLALGLTLQIEATALDADANPLADENFTWESSAPEIATVDATGLVTGVGLGEATITATSQSDPTISATAIVTVVAGQVDTVTVTPQTSLLFVGETVQLQATAFNAAGEPIEDVEFFWSVPFDTTIASVDSATGLVTAEAFDPDNDTVVVTATAEGVQGTATVTVQQVPVDSIAIATADENEDFEIEEGETVQLAATAFDIDGNELPGRAAAWSSSDANTATVDPATGLVTGVAAGTATITAEIDGVTSSVEIAVVEPFVNTPPVADAGADQTVTAGDLVTLDAVGSSDVDAGQTLTYSWALTVPGGSGALLSNSAGQQVTFTAGVAGTYVAELTVSDGTDTATDTVTITAEPANTAPIADAGTDQTVTENTPVSLDATGSADAEDASGALTFAWAVSSEPVGSAVALAGAATATPTFTPTVAGAYVLEVTVTDTGALSDTDTVTITVEAFVNTAPVADAGTDQTVTAGDLVTLDAVGSSDVDAGQTLTYAWVLTVPGGSGAMLSNSTGQQVTFTADVAGTYTAELTVSDGTDTATDTVTITAEPANTAPTADAGSDQTVTVNTAVSLDAAASADAEDDASATPLGFSWAFTADPSAGADALTGADTATPSFTPTVAGDYVLTLTVTDSGGLTATDAVTITAEPVATTMDCLIISEYVEGSGLNKAIELYNCGTTSIDLTNYGYCAEQNTDDALAAGCTSTYNITGQLAAGDTVVLCNPSADAGVLTVCDQQTGTVNHNGDDRILIFKDVNADSAFTAADDPIVDVFGELGNPNDVYGEATYDRCNFTPFLGGGTFTVLDFYTQAAADTFTGLGVAPTETCPAP
jgi:uncharacterized protein YjdB